MNDTTHEIDWRNTLPEELEGHRCIAVTKTGKTLEGVLEYRTTQPDMYVRIDSLHLPDVKEWVIVNQCESGNEMGEGFVSVKVFDGDGGMNTLAESCVKAWNDIPDPEKQASLLPESMRGRYWGFLCADADLDDWEWKKKGLDKAWDMFMRDLSDLAADMDAEELDDWLRQLRDATEGKVR